MINFNNFSKEETAELFSLIQKNIEKSDLERIYLFTQDDKERAILFLWCHRFLCNVYNLIDEGKIKEEIKKEINLTKDRYNNILLIMSYIKNNKILVHRFERQLFNALNCDSLVNNLIDAFSVFIEREIISSMAKLKGFYLEGKSGKEFKRIFKETQEQEIVKEENFEELTKDEEIIKEDLKEQEKEPEEQENE